jgi:fucose 4-O-acetylase-like acetyltransferase
MNKTLFAVIAFIALGLFNCFMVSIAFLGPYALQVLSFIVFWLACVLVALKAKNPWIVYLGQAPITILLIYRMIQSILSNLTAQYPDLSFLSFISGCLIIIIGCFLSWVIARAIGPRSELG